MAAADDEVFRFDVFQLDVRARRLLCRDQEIQLRPKQYEVLHHLIRHHGKSVAIRELLDACWGDINVGPNSVTNVIYALRSVFESGVGANDWIKTIPRHGYRFVAPLERFSPPVPSMAAAPTGRAIREPRAKPDLFVGREPELAGLEQCWAQVQQGVPATVFVSGEAGIGKTALVRHFCATAEPAPVLCVGRCIPQHREAEPYMPVLEALASLADTEEVAATAREQAPTWLSQMPWLIPLAERAALGSSTAGAGSARMLREGKRLLAALASRAPLVVVLEDVHWADMATVDLIRALAQSDDTSGLMLIATYRPSEVIVHAHPLRELIGALAAQQHCEFIALGSLTRAEIRQYLERRFNSATVATQLAPRLEEHSGGQPLFLDAITTHLCEQQRIIRQDQGWTLTTAAADLIVDLPVGLREMIRTRLRGLRVEDKQLIEAAAVAGMDFTSLDIAAALNMDPVRVEDRCENLAHEGHFIEAIGEARWPDGSLGAGYSFAHAAYRDALLGDMPRSRARVLHRRIGERLEGAFGERAREIAPRLATHFAAAGDLQRQIQYLEQSIRLSVARYAHQDSLAYLDRILTVLRQLPDDEARAAREVGYQVERSRLLMDWKGYAAGLESFARVVELAQRQGNRFLEFFGRVGCCLGQLMSAGYRSDHAGEGEALLRIATEGHPELTALAHVMAGSECDAGGDLAGALAHAEAALAALPSALGGIPRGFDLETLIRILLQSSLGRLGQLERCRRQRQLAIEGAEQRSGLGGKAHSFAFLACDALIVGEPAVALTLARRATDHAREGDFDRYLIAGEAITEAAQIALSADAEIDAASLARLASAVAERRRMNEMWFNGLLAATLTDGYRRRGDLAQARACIEEAFGDAGIVYSAEVWRTKGELEMAIAASTKTASQRTTARKQAIDCFETALAVSRQHGTRLFELRAATALAHHAKGGGGTRQTLAQLVREFPTRATSSDWHAATAVLAEVQ